MKRTLAKLALLSLSLAPIAAHAGFIGSTLRIEPQFSSIGSVCCGTGTYVVGAGIEVPTGTYPFYNGNAYADISNTQIEVGQVDSTFYSSGAFNGFHIGDETDNLAEIVGVSINALTDLAGFDASRITFDGDNIYLNFESLVPGAAHRVVVDVLFSDRPDVPAPASLALMCIALAGIGAMARSRS